MKFNQLVLNKLNFLYYANIYTLRRLLKLSAIQYYKPPYSVQQRSLYVCISPITNCCELTTTL
jgi:hypothetical protein